MTTEPRQEANAVVRSFALAARRTAEGHVSPETFKQRSDRLVDALAAAIELDDARHGREDGRGEIEQEDAEGRARLRLSVALSALREDET